MCLLARDEERFAVVFACILWFFKKSMRLVPAVENRLLLARVRAVLRVVVAVRQLRVLDEAVDKLERTSGRILHFRLKNAHLFLQHDFLMWPPVANRSEVHVHE